MRRTDTNTGTVNSDCSAGLVMRRFYEYAVMAGGVLLFSCASVLVGAGGIFPGLLMPGPVRRRWGRWLLHRFSRGLMWAYQSSGILHFDLKDLDPLRDEDSLVIVANHPSLIDALLIASRLPNLFCVVKSGLRRNPIISGAVWAAGYVPNDSGLQFVKATARLFPEGGHLLVFPEGTRTATPPLGPMRGGFALAAKKNKIPVQTVVLTTDSRFLSKGWPLWKRPEFPLHYKARLGERLIPGDGESVKQLIIRVEMSLRKELEPEE